jgi:predicted transcriptional regulator
MRDTADQAEDAAAGPGRRHAGELEAAVLEVLQRGESALSPGEVRERIGGDLAYTTVVTILSRLHAKGVLERRKSGRSYRYAPVADSPGLAARRMTRVLDEEADRAAVLARFVSSLSESDEELLRQMLGEGG